ncbi:TPA: hypothetical protein DF272_01215 [Candidatus Falkowbacteria bacterium]|nr:hypothetical protein [Candidatus Falkowbacteria bacterium]
MSSHAANKVGISKLYVKFIAVFVVLTIVLIFVIFYFSFSRALIRITPKPASVATDFIADINTQDNEPTAGTLKGFLFETEVDMTKEYPATGTKDAEGNVIGQVSIINKRTVNQPLVATTRLITTDGVLLRIKNRVDVPAGGSVNADVYADDPSSFTTLAATKFTIPGLSESLQNEVYAESKTSLNSAPGALKVVKSVDVARAKDDLTAALYQKALADFEAEVSEGYVAVLVDKKVVEEAVSAGIDDVAETFTVRQKMNVTLIGLEQPAIVSLSAERLRELVTGERELSEIMLDKLTYVVQNYNQENKTANIKVHAEGETVLKENSEILDKSKIAGLSDKGVELYLDSFDEIESVEVQLSPFWVKRVPSLPDNIVIEVVTD